MRALILGTALATLAVPALAAGLTVTSPAIKDGGPIGMAQVFNGFGCKGENHSPALAWSGEPAGTMSFAVTIFDPDAPTGSGWWHWTVFNIPASVHGLPADAGADGSPLLPEGAGEGLTDFGFAHYVGPCPPPGPAHHYHIAVYALKVPKLQLDAHATGATVGFAIHANTLAKAEIVGTFGRSP
jgi:Raf kinase inhibitor-like YbhB/YbcL family protein